MKVFWHACGGEPLASELDIILQALSKSGFDAVRASQPTGECSAAVLFLGPSVIATYEAEDAVRLWSPAGFGRLVVVLPNSISSHSDLAWRLMSLGAAEVISRKTLVATPEALVLRLERWAAVDKIVASPLVANNLIGRSEPWISLLRQVVEVAHFTTAPIVITGESGTGKELLARLIHTLDAREAKKDLVTLDCTTVVPDLSGSEFFGHEKGAFTNAQAARDGAFALADGGTLFLDEVGELPAAMQAQLLRVVQEKTYKRLGSNTWHKTDFRLVCATNRDLRRDVEEGAFRRDLYYRLAAWVFRVPPLRERPEDTMLLAQHFLASIYPDKAKNGFCPSLCSFFGRRSYAGNVRDLRQLVLRIGARHVGPGLIGMGAIPDDERPASTAIHGLADSWPDTTFQLAISQAVTRGVALKEISRAATEVAVRAALKECGSVQEAARRLGVTDRALQLRRAGRTREGRQAPSSICLPTGITAARSLPVPPAWRVPG